MHACVYNTPIIHAESDIAFKAFMRILIKRESSGKNDKLPDANGTENLQEPICQ